MAAAGACGPAAETSPVDVRELTLPLPSEPLRIEVALDCGDIVVLREPVDEIRVTGRLLSSSRERLDQAEVVADLGKGSSLHVDVRWPGGTRQSGDACDLVVRVPSASSLELRTGEGNVVVSGFVAMARIEAKDGTIEVRDYEGKVEIESGDGSVAVSGKLEEVRVQATRGSIDIRGALGPVSAISTEGQIEIRTDLKEGVGPIIAETAKGSLLLEAGPAFAGALLIETKDGAITCTPPEGAVVHERSAARWRLELGGSEPASRLRTLAGNIRVTWAGR